MKYTDLIFDLYGTLVDIHTDENDAVWEKTAIYFGFYGAHYTGKQLRESFHSLMARQEAQAGQDYECFPDIPCEHFFAQLFRERGIIQNADRLGIAAAQLFRIASIEYIRSYPNVSESLHKLKDSGYRLWLLSNAQRVFTAFELRHLNLEEIFDGIYISSDYRCRKPDQRFFHALMSQQNLDPSKCLMIGNDRMTDIAGARKAGMDTLYMHTNITPPGQEMADPSLLPGIAPTGCRHYEFEGSDWNQLTDLILKL